MPAQYTAVESINVPRALTDMMRRRTQAIIWAAVRWPNALEVIAISCYAQGLADAQDVIEQQAAAKDSSAPSVNAD